MGRFYSPRVGTVALFIAPNLPLVVGDAGDVVISTTRDGVGAWGDLGRDGVIGCFAEKSRARPAGFEPATYGLEIWPDPSDERRTSKIIEESGVS